MLFFPTKMLHLNAPFSPLKCTVTPKKVTRGFFITCNVLTGCWNGIRSITSWQNVKQQKLTFPQSPHFEFRGFSSLCSFLLKKKNTFTKKVTRGFFITCNVLTGCWNGIRSITSWQNVKQQKLTFPQSPHFEFRGFSSLCSFLLKKKKQLYLIYFL